MALRSGMYTFLLAQGQHEAMRADMLWHAGKSMFDFALLQQQLKSIFVCPPAFRQCVHSNMPPCPCEARRLPLHALTPLGMRKNTFRMAVLPLRGTPCQVYEFQ